MSFDLGEFTRGEAEVGTGALSWRLDQAASLSDWTIRVKRNASDGDADTHEVEYSVHRTVLGFAPRCSDHFSRIFISSGGRFAEDAGCATELVLEDSAADAFPAFLDFLYGCELAVTTQNAAALRHYASYFAVSEVGPPPLHSQSHCLRLI